MSSCSKTSGGVPPNHGTAEATTNQPKQKKARTSVSAESIAKNGDTAEYRSRLRPRPTKQTSHFKTPAFPVRSVKHLSRQSASEQGLSLAKSQSATSINSSNLPSTSRGRATKEVTKKLATSRAVSPSSCESTKISKNSGKSVLAVTADKKAVPVTKSSTGSHSSKKGSSSGVRSGKRPLLSTPLSPRSGLKPRKKLASHSNPEKKPASEETGSVVNCQSGETPTTSKHISGGKSDSRSNRNSSKAASKFPLSKKSKSAESKSGFFAKHSSRRKSGKGDSATSSTISSSVKTGSCASSRRGSERGKRTSAVARSADPPLTSDEGCSGASSNQSMHRSRHSRELGSHPRAGVESGETEAAAASRTSASAGVVASSMNATASSNESESEDADVTRLQALLEARGLPPHFFGNLGPRMQQILHRSMGSGSANSKAQQYLQGIQAAGDESRQLQAAIGMCQLLVMGNEDTLAGFPIKSAVPALISLLRMEHNFDLMNHACRALTYMMEALPRSSAIVVDAVPVFLEKLQVIQCMDVAEQSLTALDMLSKRHAPAILAAGGLSSCLLYIDFFSLPAQRSALSVAANCCLAVGTASPDTSSPMDEFNRLVKTSLPLLTTRLVHHDKKCVESACLCFVRLIDNFQQDAKILTKIAENELFKNFQELLVVTPPLLSSSTFVMVIRSMTIMCSRVRVIADGLVKHNVAETLRYLLCGTAPENENGQVELASRSPQELFEITSLIGELMPKLPKCDPLFSINALIWQDSDSDPTRRGSCADRANWQWKDESGQWRSYTRHDSRMIEAAHMAGEQEVDLTTMGRSYTVDFEAMQQINDDTGTARAVQRLLWKRQHGDSSKKISRKQDAQPCEDLCVSPGETVVEQTQLIKTLFTILYEVYSSSAGSPAVRYKCLRALQRMVFYAEPDLLCEVLRNLTVSSHISSMLSSPDDKVVVGALQMAEMLMKKLPVIFAEMFHREGVLHQVKKLIEYSQTAKSSSGGLKSPSSHTSSKSSVGQEAESPTVKSGSHPWDASSSSLAPGSVQTRVTPPLTKAKAFAAALTTKDGDVPAGAKKKISRSTRATRSSTSSFFSSLNPTKWGRSLSSALSSDSSRSGSTESGGAQPSRSEVKNSSKLKRNSLGLSNLDKWTSYKESSDRVKEWIGTRASTFLEEHFTENADNNNQQTSVLDQLTTVAKNLLDASMAKQRKSLEELNTILSSVDVSSFELQHSGLVTSLLHYLTSAVLSDEHAEPANPIGHFDQVDSRDALYSRIRCFLAVFAGLPIDSLVKLEDSICHIGPSQVAPIVNLVRKLNQCVGQLEQLPVKTHDLMSGSSQVLRVLSTHQLKCQLQRHPDCHNVKQWLGGPVKVDPLVQVQAIERYLLARGYGVKTSGAGPPDIGKHLELVMLQDEGDDSEDEIQGDGDEDQLSFDDNSSGCFSSEPDSHMSSVPGTAASSSSTAFGDTSETRDRKPSAGSSHKLEFYIGDKKLPHHITVYQAICQHNEPSGNISSDDESDVSFKISENARVWNRTHVIRYKLVGMNEEFCASNKGGAKHRSAKKPKATGKVGRGLPRSPKPNDALWTDGVLAEPHLRLEKYLVAELPPECTVVDACLEVLCLLRVVHAINRYWTDLYSPNVVLTDRPLVMSSEFINFKINAKCTRQLQDPLIIITGQLTTWLQQIATVCPFLLSFETRQLLFKITAFDRDRAMQHLLDTGAAQELSSALSNASSPGDSRSHSSSRFMPRLEKKKCSVSRKNLLQQAEKIIFDHAHSRAVLEVDYENEVGTGLGPTLEFFTLTSKELQQSALNLWREELIAGKQPALPDEEPIKSNDVCKAEAVSKVTCEMPLKDRLVLEEGSGTSTDIKKLAEKDASEDESRQFVNSPMGLFPKPVGRTAKLGQVNRIKAKFRFLGKFLAKALMDGRMVDLPLSVACYKWLLGEEQSFCALDLEYVDPGMAPTFNKLRKVAHECELMKISDADNIESVMMDGCSIEDLGFDMQLPGYPNVELMKLGRNIPVTIHNLDKFLKLIVHWTLVEGVRRQMEALKEGFESVLPLTSFSYFFPEELDQLFCGSRYEPWDVRDLREMCHPDHGYTQDSPAVQRLYRILATYDLSQQRSFLQFVTGCPHLPVGGFRSLNPRLTIVRKNCEEGENIDDYLPSVMTCLNYLKLPDYSTEEIMRTKLQLAAAEGLNSFLLS